MKEAEITFLNLSFYLFGAHMGGGLARLCTYCTSLFTHSKITAKEVKREQESDVDMNLGVAKRVHA